MSFSPVIAGVDRRLWLSSGVRERRGLAGNEENGPSVESPRFGGRPRFPVDEAPLLGQADDTAGPCRRRLRLLSRVDGVTADRGSVESTPSLGLLVLGTTADWGYQRISWPEKESPFAPFEGNDDAAAQGSEASRSSGKALKGIALWGKFAE